MSPVTPPRAWAIALWMASALAPATAVGDGPPPDSPLVRLLKASANSEDRRARVVDQIGRRGTPDDLAHLYREATDPAPQPPDRRLRSLRALVEAATNRRTLPAGGVGPGLVAILGSGDPAIDDAVKVEATRLAGAAKAPGAVEVLAAIADRPATPGPARRAAFDALVEIGDGPAREAIGRLTTRESPAVRLGAIAALSRSDPARAADLAAGAIGASADPAQTEALIAPFLNLKGGPDLLAAALSKAPPPADPARLALRSMYALGRSDAGLAAALTRAAGIDAEPSAPDAAAMAAIVAEVEARGDAARGEAVFRRADLNCAKCHALAGAGGGVGPELSAVGSVSPVDYLVNSIVVPDQSIKEVYQTRIISTADGRIFQGIVVDKDADKWVLREAGGDLRTIPAADVEESREGGSLMPKGLVNLMTHAEFVDLLKFLSLLGKPGPYAIQSAPVLRRWQVSAAPMDDSPAPPGPADPRWSTAYATLSGDLPASDLPPGDGPAWLRAAFDATSAGSLTLLANSPDGLAAQLDGRPVPVSAGSPPVEVSQGPHTLLIKVDRRARGGRPIRVELGRPAGSGASVSIRNANP